MQSKLNHAGRPGAATVLAVAAVLAGLIAALALAPGATAAPAKRPASKVKVRIITGSQSSLMSKGVKVKVRANGKAKVRLKAVAGSKRLLRARTVRLARRGAKRVTLRLTGRGRARLSTCGAKRVRIAGAYRRAVRRKGKLVKRAAKATARRKLRFDPSRCGTSAPPQPPAPAPQPKKALCDPLDPAVCLQPWPSNYHTVPAGTETGIRLDLPVEAMPTNAAGKPVDPTDINRADGFSPGNLITLKIPEVDTPAAFDNSNIVPIDDMHRYADPNAPVMVINARTGERQPIWAELDSNPTTVNPTYDRTDPDNPVLLDAGGINQNPSNTGPVNLIIRPAVNFDEGERYVVVLRNLRDAQDRPVDAPAPFRSCRDGEQISDPALLYRCGTLKKDVFPVLDANGISRQGLYMSWDFTVASEESLTGRAVEIRDDAFKRLGDTDLSDLEVQGDSPEFTIDTVENYSEAQNPQIMRHIRGRLLGMPCYLNQDGCPTGSSFAFGADGEITWNPQFTTDVPFRCNIPRSAVQDGEVVPSRPGLYGHGLLGSLSQVNSQVDQSFEHNMLFCAVDWAGFSGEDAGTVLTALQDVSNFSKLTDRMQQGFVNFMMVGRAMIHPDGFNTAAAFQVDPDGGGPEEATPVIDTERLFYEGKSQGGIMGGALTALAPDFERAVLNVPGMNYSTLLQRSVDFDEYAEGIIDGMYLPGVGLYDNYPNLGERQLVFSLMQLLWDRGEPNGYAHHITDDPLPNTPEHQVLYQVDVGDHQVANVTAEVAARTVGARIYQPALDPGRHWDVNPFMGLEPIEEFPYGGSAITYWDGGPADWFYGGPECGESPGSEDYPCQGTAVAPIQNVPPRPEWGFGGDPHNYSRDAIAGRQQASDFMQVDGYLNPCPNGGPCYANGWTGPTP